MGRPVLFRFYVDCIGPIGGGEIDYCVENVFAPNAAEAVEQVKRALRPHFGARVLSAAGELDAPDCVLEDSADGKPLVRAIRDLDATEKQRVLAILAVQSGLLARAA